MAIAVEAEAVQFWSFFRRETSRLVSEAGEILARHLRETPLAMRDLSRGSSHGAAELRLGRSVLRVESPFVCTTPGPRERHLAEVFGEDTPLARVFVYRDEPYPALVGHVAADPATGRWIGDPSETGAVPMTDTAALESFLWSLFTDTHPLA